MTERLVVKRRVEEIVAYDLTDEEAEAFKSSPQERQEVWDALTIHGDREESVEVLGEEILSIQVETVV